MELSPADLEAHGDTLAPGVASGATLVLDEPLSFWGGVDPETGKIIDTHHPQVGMSLAGRILVMPGGRGSSSSSSVFAETIRNGTAPAALILGSRDPILALGALVARELYGRETAVVWVGQDAYEACRGARTISVRTDGDRAALVFEGGR